MVILQERHLGWERGNEGEDTACAHSQPSPCAIREHSLVSGCQHPDSLPEGLVFFGR